MQRLTCTLTLYMNVWNFLRSLPSLVCRDCDMVCVCVCIIVPLGTASQHFSMLGIPLRGPIIPMGKSNILKKKKSRKQIGLCMFQNHLFIWEITVFRASKTIFRGWKQGRAPTYTMIFSTVRHYTCPTKNCSKAHVVRNIYRPHEYYSCK